MKLARFRTKRGDVALGWARDGYVLECEQLARAAKSTWTIEGAGDWIDVLCSDGRSVEELKALDAWARAEGWSGAEREEEVELLSPLRRPGKIVCLAANFAKHVEESGRKVADKEGRIPRLFMKPSSSVTGPGSCIELPKDLGQKIDYEGELAVVIGDYARSVPAVDSRRHVLGFTICNDVSARQIDTPGRKTVDEWDTYFDWASGKWFDTFAPIGPYLVVDDFDLDSAPRLTTLVNGEVRQDESLAEMVFSVDEAISWSSKFMQLEPGDVLLMGTPSGVGRPTGRFLRSGDTVEVKIEGLGLLRNVVV